MKSFPELQEAIDILDTTQKQEKRQFQTLKKKSRCQHLKALKSKAD